MMKMKNLSKRALDKAAARFADEQKLRSGVVAPSEMARVNGGGIRKVKHVGPYARMQRLAEGLPYNGNM